MKNNGILVLASSSPEKSIDGKGIIERGVFYVDGDRYENAFLVDGIYIYSKDGVYIGIDDRYNPEA